MRLALPALASLLLTLPAIAQENEASLRWDLAAGRAWRLRVTQDEVMTEGGTELQAKKQVHDVSLTVREVLEAGDVRVALRIERMRIDLREGGVETMIDSADPSASGPEVALVNKDIVMLATTRGELKLVESFGGERVDRAPPAQRAQIRAVLGEGVFHNLFLGLLSPLPEAPVRAGTTWTASQRIPAGSFIMTLRVTNRVEDVAEGGAVEVTQRGEASVEDDGDPDTPEMVMDASKVEATFQLAGGVLRSSKGLNEMTMTINGRTMLSRSTIERVLLD